MQTIIDNLAPLAAHHTQEITRLYNAYVPAVSTQQHAISLELSFFLYRLMFATKPDAVADFGSGFSSVVLRYYCKNNPLVEVVSMDDDLGWLDKTRDFLMSQGLDIAHLYNWPTMIGGFDVLVYDLGTINTRIQNIDKPFNMVSNNGALILTDAHLDGATSTANNLSPPYLADVMEDEISRRGFQQLSLENLTKDSLGRFSKIAWEQECPNGDCGNWVP